MVCLLPFSVALSHTSWHHTVVFESNQAFIVSHRSFRRLWPSKTIIRLSTAKSKRCKRLSAEPGTPLKSVILANPRSVPLTDMFNNSGAKALDVLKTLEDVEIKVQHIENVSLKLSSLPSLVDPSKTTAGNLAAEEHFSEYATNEAYKRIVNARNATGSIYPTQCLWKECTPLAAEENTKIIA